MNLEETIREIPIEDIIPNRFQPRLTFDEQGLEDLANSIREHGIIQPLVVRKVEDKYEIIAGERRYKAATLAGLKKVPAIISNIDDNKSAEVAIVENVQRRDLTSIEEARSYKNLLDKGYLTQTELAKKMGISQSAIANKLRLLNLDESVQDALLKNEISERHARSLLVLENKEDQKKWLEKVIKERMTVRELDEALKKLNSTNSSKEEDDDTDVPLVKALDIDAIRKEATELPRIDGESEIARKLREIENERRYNPDVVPVEQATDKSKGSFFNFLEDETVNMNTEENNLKIPSVNFGNGIIEETPQEEKIEKQEERKEEPQEFGMPLFPSNDEKKEEETPVTEEKTTEKDTEVNIEEEQKEETTTEPVEAPIVPELPKNEENEEKEIEEKPTFGTPNPNLLEEKENFDPVELIDMLDPEFAKKEEERQGIDLKTAINAIREAKDTLSSKGFTISMEETDLTDTYQFIIKIKK